jgi:DivIVA domain-containing protein
MGRVETIERIRNATFTLTRRGYDRREVDSYLSKLADWLEGGGADQIHGDTIKHELERIGRRTSKILTAAEEAAQGMQADAEHEARRIKEDARASVDGIRTSADDYAKRTREEAQAHATKVREGAEAQVRRQRSEAEAHATKVRDEAEGYATRVRSEADAHAANVVKEAEAKAIRMVEEGAARRRQMEKVIADLQSRREAVVNGLEKLSSQLAGAASQGKAVADPADGKPASGAGLPDKDTRQQVRESGPSPAPGENSKQDAAARQSPPAPSRQ